MRLPPASRPAAPAPVARGFSAAVLPWLAIIATLRSPPARAESVRFGVAAVLAPSWRLMDPWAAKSCSGVFSPFSRLRTVMSPELELRSMPPLASAPFWSRMPPPLLILSWPAPAGSRSRNPTAIG